MWPLWLVEMLSHHIQKNSPGLLYIPAKYEKSAPYSIGAIAKTKCGSGGAGRLASPNNDIKFIVSTLTRGIYEIHVNNFKIVVDNLLYYKWSVNDTDIAWKKMFTVTNQRSPKILSHTSSPVGKTIDFKTFLTWNVQPKVQNIITSLAKIPPILLKAGICIPYFSSSFLIALISSSKIEANIQYREHIWWPAACCKY